MAFLMPLSAFSQGDSKDLPADSSRVEVRTVDAQTLQSITNEDVFEYNELPQNPDTFWSRVKQWLIQIIQSIANNPWTSLFIRVVFFGIFGLVLIGLINQLLKGNLSTAFSKKKAGQQVSLNIGESNPATTNYDKLLEAALAQNNYHDAVRLLYLKALKRLSVGNIITWKPDKTNHDYLLEIGNHPAKSPFSQLTLYYDYVEYGDFEIDQSGFLQVQDIYKRFKEKSGLDG